MDKSRTLVISFQRSGLNWLRHCAEHFGGIRTPGRAQLIAEGPLLFDRTHDVSRPNKRSDYTTLRDSAGHEIYNRVALLIRNPYDCFTSEYYGRRRWRFSDAIKHFEVLPNNILAFDGLANAERKIFYFEDYVSKGEGTMAFLHFLGITVDSEKADFPALVEASKAWYRQQHGLMDERKKPELKPSERVKIRRMLESKLGALFSIYLGRYDRD